MFLVKIADRMFLSSRKTKNSLESGFEPASILEGSERSQDFHGEFSVTPIVCSFSLGNFGITPTI